MGLETVKPEDIDRVANEIAKDLFPAIKNQAIIQLDVAVPKMSPGESAEMHEESIDKNDLRKFIVGLTGDRVGERVQFGEEVEFKSVCPTGPSGIIDLLVGTKMNSVDNAELIIRSVPPSKGQTVKTDVELVCRNLDQSVMYVTNTTLGESKNLSVNLSIQNPQPVCERFPQLVPQSQKAKPVTMGVTVAQPVLTLLSVGMLYSSESPQVLLYGNRHKIRPFLYYKNTDILLTTDHDFDWRDECRLNLYGVCAVAMLLRYRSTDPNPNAIKYVNSTTLEALFKSLKFHQLVSRRQC